MNCASNGLSQKLFDSSMTGEKALNDGEAKLEVSTSGWLAAWLAA